MMEYMEGFYIMEPITRGQIIISIISTILGSGVLNGIIAHILYNRKLRKEQKVRVQNMVWDKIIEALEQIRDIELKVRVQEKWNFREELEAEGYIDAFEGAGIYPEIMNDHDCFFNFYTEINEARSKWAKYMDPEVGSYLYYMERYCLQLIQYITKNGLVNNYPLAGTVFIIDLQKWQREYEKLLVKRLNRPKHKVYTEDGRSWKRAKKKIMKKFWNTSCLKALIEDRNTPPVNVLKAMLFGTNDMKKVFRELDEYRKRHPIKSRLKEW